MSRTCHELGVCQQRTPSCRGCEPIQAPVQQKTIRFAPGVIQCPARTRQRASLARWMGRALGLMVIAGVVGLVAGLITGSL